MDRTTKEAAVEELSEIFGSAGSVVLTRYSGLTVAEMTKLRGDLREVGGKLKVVRNRLAKIALKGQKGEAASDMFEGPANGTWPFRLAPHGRVPRRLLEKNTLGLETCFASPGLDKPRWAWNTNHLRGWIK